MNIDVHFFLEMIAFKDYSGTVEIGKNISYEMYLKNKQPAMPSVNMETDNLPLVEAAKIVSEFLILFINIIYKTNVV